jgi:hypothetical protein
VSRNEDLDTGIWDDPDFEVLTVEGKALYLWSWSNRRCGMAGLYKVSRRAMCSALNLVEEERLNAALQEVEEARFLFYDGTWLWVRSRAKLLMPKTPQMAKSVAKDFAKIPTAHPYRARFIEELEGVTWVLKGLEKDGLLTVTRPSLDGQVMVKDLAQQDKISDGHLTVTRPSPDGPGKEQEQEQEQRRTTGSQSRGNVDARARSKQVDQDAPPATLADELKPTAAGVLAVLLRVHAERGGNTPTLRGVGLVVAAFPDRDHLTVAGELEHWAVAGTGQRRDVRDWVATYRRFLTNAPAGTPSRQRAATSLGDGVLKAAQLRRADEEETRRIVAETQNQTNQGDTE